MPNDLASSITKAASKQTYYTIRFLADRERVPDAYRSYAYFRWVDDVLDSDAAGVAASERRDFLNRQKVLLDSCYRGEFPPDVNPQENMLVELVRQDQEKDSGLQAYLRNMMLVMDFDARRRGRLVSQKELDEYTQRLSVAVTENMHYFIGHGDASPREESRYHAVFAAHVAHMLRDTYDDLQAGYINIPREVLAAHRIGPHDVHHPAYRAWVKRRVELAHGLFQSGKMYFRKTRSRRHRLAGFAYIARFEWLLETLEKEQFTLRPRYDDRKSADAGLKMIGLAFSSLADFHGMEPAKQPVDTRCKENT
jgi:phytoene/squalene synthetase